MKARGTHPAHRRHGRHRPGGRGRPARRRRARDAHRPLAPVAGGDGTRTAQPARRRRPGGALGGDRPARGGSGPLAEHAAALAMQRAGAQRRPPAFGALETMDAAQMTAVLQTNLLAPMLLTRALLPHLRRQPRAQVICVGSVLGALGLPGFSVYSASKFGLRGFAEALGANSPTPACACSTSARAAHAPSTSAGVQAYNQPRARRWTAWPRSPRPCCRCWKTRAPSASWASRKTGRAPQRPRARGHGRQLPPPRAASPPLPTLRGIRTMQATTLASFPRRLFLGAALALPPWAPGPPPSTMRLPNCSASGK